MADTQSRVDATDADLARKVRLFLHSSRTGFRLISVWAEMGTITLSGVVGSFFLRQLAIVMAKRVAGVRHAIDDLEVDLESMNSVKEEAGEERAPH